jgi:hypothetical protein
MCVCVCVLFVLFMYVCMYVCMYVYLLEKDDCCIGILAERLVCVFVCVCVWFFKRNVFMHTHTHTHIIYRQYNLSISHHTIYAIRLSYMNDR